MFLLYSCHIIPKLDHGFLWHSFVEAVTPGHDQPSQGGGGHHNCIVGGHPLSHEPVESHVRETHSRSSPDHRGVPGDPNVTWRKLLTKVRVEESGSEDEEEFEDSRENLPPKDPIGHSSGQEQAPIPQSTSSHLTHLLGVSQGGQGEVHHEGVMDHANLIKDAKFYQDAVLDYQNGYAALHGQLIELQGRYSIQASLIEEASAAVKFVEAEAQCQHQQLLDVQHDYQVEIEAAVTRAIEQYKVQLNNAQSSLQSKVQSLEVSLASQVNLPSVGVTHPHDGSDLCKEVFNFLPGTVNKQCGAVGYDS